MNKYYYVVGLFDNERETLFGSFVRNDCVSTIEYEGENWIEEGYSSIQIISEETTDKPCPIVYADDIKDGLL